MDTAPRPPGECLDEDQVERYVASRLTEPERASAEAHLDACSRCRTWVSELARDDAPPEPPHGPSRTPAPPGELRRGSLLGRYVLLDALGAGGMGRVYLAWDPELQRKVAIKLLRPDAEGLDRQLLLREGRVMARLSHPHVVSVYDVGTLGDQVYVTLEYIEGQTLDRWLAAAPRSLSQVLDAFEQAGNGLIAAHEAGLLHRDFKPANVLVGSTGRVCVSDFGLARAASEAAGATSPGGAEAKPTLTAAAAGTPAYMAPEQCRGAVVDARADQYSFCVALYEALCGRRPLEVDAAGNPVGTLGARAPALASGSRMPGWLWQTLQRGLAEDPAQRHDSMRALLERLRRRRLSRRSFAVALAVAVVVAAVAWAALAQLAKARACRTPAFPLDGAWDAPLRTKLREAFAASGRSFADDTVQRVEARLDAYATQLLAEQEKACLATRLREQLPESVLLLRQLCLERRTRELGALVRQLADADGALVERSVEMTSGLVDVARCADLEELTSAAPPPSTPGVRERVAAVQRELAEAQALEAAGRYAPGLTVAARAADEARALGYRPLEAEAELQRGRLEAAAGHAKEGAEALKRALWSAQAAGADATASRALVELVTVEGFLLAQPAPAHERAREAEAMIERRHGDDALSARLLANEGQVYQQEGKYEEALKLLRQSLALAERRIDDTLAQAQAANQLAIALRSKASYVEALPHAHRAAELRERALGPSHPQTASSLSTEGNVLSLLRRHEEAIALHRRALEIRKRALGEAHPDVGGSLMNLGSTLTAAGSPAEGLGYVEQAIANWRVSKGPTHPHVASALNTASQSCEQLGLLQKGLGYAQEGLALREKALGPEHVEVAMSLINLGSLQLAAGDPAKALPSFERALAIRQKVLGAQNPELARELLGIGQAWVARRSAERAHPVLERAAALVEGERSDALLAAQVRFELASLLARGGQRERARGLAKKAQEALSGTSPAEVNLRTKVEGLLASLSR